MSISTEEPELRIIIDHICDYISGLIFAEGPQDAKLRRQIGDIRAHGLEYLQDKVFGTKLWECFETARVLAITADRVALVRIQIYNEVPTGMIAILLVETAILYCLTTESIQITKQTFRSSDDAQVMMKRMKLAFDQARDQAADRMDSATYQNLTYLSGSLINHLSKTALLLPRIVQIQLQTNLPSLWHSQYLYQTADRSDELLDQNRVVHPLFMPMEITGLNA